MNYRNDRRRNRNGSHRGPTSVPIPKLAIDLMEEAWKSYESAVVPETADVTQRIETRRGFYAGAHIVLCALREISQPGYPESKGMATIQNMHESVDLFARRQMKANRDGQT
jgi:hypothetical protein